MTTRINAVHHLAVSTADMVAQIEFFTDVLGAELVGLFWMHGVPGGKHCFLRLNDHSSMSFVDLPANHDIEAELGVTHAGTGAGPSAPGTVQHVAFNVDSLDELLALRDRIRSRGINVMGHIDHGMCYSIYFAGPEGLTLEVAVSQGAMNPEAWIDPEVVATYDITDDQLAAFKSPATYAGEGGAVAQPPMDPDKPHLAYPTEEYEQVLATPDELILQFASIPDPPVAIADS
jgi:catechol 2,3-dioxygenase-like lactoylglutathione lyase family enzyme